MAINCFVRSKPKTETCDSECFVFIKFSHLIFITFFGSDFSAVLKMLSKIMHFPPRIEIFFEIVIKS